MNDDLLSQEQAPAPQEAFRLELVTFTDGRVALNGPVHEKTQCIEALTAAIQAVLRYQPQPAGIVLAQQVPAVPPALRRRLNGLARG